MIREADSIYIEKETRKRASKDYGSYGDSVKKELHRIHDEMIKSDSPELIEDFAFWSAEMSRQVGAQHKFRKKCNKRYTPERLRGIVLDEIKYAVSQNRRTICKDNIQIKTGARSSDLDKVFMQLNREGILSQAIHQMMHDSRRVTGEQTVSSDFTRESDWASDFYYIYNEEFLLYYNKN